MQLYRDKSCPIENSKQTPSPRLWKWNLTSIIEVRWAVEWLMEKTPNEVWKLCILARFREVVCFWNPQIDEDRSKKIIVPSGIENCNRYYKHFRVLWIIQMNDEYHMKNSTWHSQWWGCRTLFQFQLLSQPHPLWQHQHQWTWRQCRCPGRQRWSGRSGSGLQTGWMATGPGRGGRVETTTVQAKNLLEGHLYIILFKVYTLQVCTKDTFTTNLVTHLIVKQPKDVRGTGTHQSWNMIMNLEILTHNGRKSVMWKALHHVSLYIDLFYQYSIIILHTDI